MKITIDTNGKKDSSLIREIIALQKYYKFEFKEVKPRSKKK